MRINCPYCGEREAHEFSYRGDATITRPDAASPEAPNAFAAYVYLRDNPAGLLREHWYHGAGCHSWLVVERDTRSHEIVSASLAREGDSP
jgi:methylglutamate dehydrogenase subunit B